MVLCVDNTLYTGITIDTQRRLQEHNTDDIKGAKYTRMRRPVTLVYTLECGTRSAACREEARIKKLTRAQKDLLINS